MNRNEKKVIFLNNVKSDYIEQAILVLKDQKGIVSQGFDEAIIKEAEKIVQNYSEAYFGRSESTKCVESVKKEEAVKTQIAPSNRKSERKLGVFIASAAAGLFAVGAAFAVFLFL